MRLEEPDVLDDGRMLADPGFAPLLRAHGLDTFASVMEFSGGRVARDFPGRKTVRLELAGPDGAKTGFYLKRYFDHYLPPARRLLRRLRWPGSEDEAWREWTMLHAVLEAGIPTATPVALGQESPGGRSIRSWLMTREIAGAVEGDQFVLTLDAMKRRRFLLRVAELARRFHAAGLVHKDFYLAHVLVVPGAPEPEMFLIDLQRVMRPCCLRKRWQVKDLAALAYSALKAGATREDLCAAFGVYLDSPDIDSRLAREIDRRVAWLSTRRPRHDANFQQLQ
jgi:Lipopolysaccharide kinase (Kdo/WaaP) family